MCAHVPGTKMNKLHTTHFRKKYTHTHMKNMYTFDMFNTPGTLVYTYMNMTYIHHYVCTV